MTNGYNYDGFDAKHYDLDQFDGPRLGQKAPDGHVTTPTGEARRLLDFDGAFLVLELGSITCPLFQSRRPGMARLAEEFPSLSHKVLYVREAHPGAVIGAHCDLSEKQSRGEELAQDGEGREVLVDDLDGVFHAGFGSYPNAVFIINQNGCVLYRSAWNNPAATHRALTRLMAGRPAGGEGLFKPATPVVALKTLHAAGKGAAADFFRSLPRLIWKNLLLRNWRLLWGRTAAVGPDALC